MKYTHTELHTHFMGMLSTDGLLKLLKMNDLGISINDFGNVDYQNGLYYEPSQFNDNYQLIKNALSISHGDSREYDSLTTLYNNRRLVLEFICDFLSKNKELDINEVRKDVYSKYLELSLDELVSDGIKYVEISFSNAKLISSFNVKNDKIRYNFLLSTDRYRNLKNFKQSSRNLEDLFEDEKSIGFDIMGCELPFSDIDKETFSNKLNIILKLLNRYGFSILRIHSGETEECINNTLDILKMIDFICNSLDITVPPPSIRIGHGIYFNESSEYLELLKKYKVMIEINASSNYALGNVSDYNMIPYNYYIDNGIPVCISTDGHGVYSTSVKTEDRIAKNVSESDRYNVLLDTDSEIERKRSIKI